MEEELELKACFKKAMEMLYDKDKDLICTTYQGKDIHNSEMGIVNHFSGYLKNILAKNKTLKKYSVDCEYCRNMGNAKELPDYDFGVRPDLIIHKRGHNYPHNLLIIEFKGWWSNRQKYGRDREKIEKFMSRVGDYRYKFGLFVVFGKKTAKVEEAKIIENGEFRWEEWGDERINRYC